MIDVSDVKWRLAELASLPYQERYVIGGTAEEYVLDTELIENVDALRYLIRRPENTGVLTESQFDAIENLLSYIHQYSGEALAAETREDAALLIRESAVWRNLRDRAAAALRLFGLSAEMPLEEIEKLHSRIDRI